MDLAHGWTGRTACALQAALRPSNESFARKLNIAVRTVAGWHQNPAIVPKPEMQQLLDIALERASEGEKSRFTSLASEASLAYRAPLATNSGHALTVAIAVVVRRPDVLIVQRRGEDGAGISWQFPAGVIKPGIAPEVVAVRETLTETGVHCHVTRHLGSRLHPVTKVYCHYLLCEYLAGEPQNNDIVENVSVTWAPADRLTRFIPAHQIFPPILDNLEVPSE